MLSMFSSARIADSWSELAGPIAFAVASSRSFLSSASVSFSSSSSLRARASFSGLARSIQLRRLTGGGEAR